MSPAELGSNTLSRTAPQFGVTNPARDLELVPRPEKGKAASVRYQQLYKGVPVIAGELLVNIDYRGRLRGSSARPRRAWTSGSSPRSLRMKLWTMPWWQLPSSKALIALTCSIRSCAVDL